MSCFYCKNPIYTEAGPSERFFMGWYRELSPPGICYGCGKGFCEKHLGYIQDFDPEVSTFGQAFWCLKCVQKGNRKIAEEYRRRVRRAKKWENWMYPIGKMVAFCIRGIKPLPK